MVGKIKNLEKVSEERENERIGGFKRGNMLELSPATEFLASSSLIRSQRMTLLKAQL